jgi:hypothetical protein
MRPGYPMETREILLKADKAALAEFRISGPKFTLADALNTIKR